MVQTFVWDKTFVTGLDIVDRQHHELIDLFNRLSDALMSDAKLSEAALVEIFETLHDYARFHFREEEQLMVRAGLDPRHQQAHCRAHAAFIEQLSCLWNSRSTMSSPSTHTRETAWHAAKHVGALHPAPVARAAGSPMPMCRPGRF